MHDIARPLESPARPRIAERNAALFESMAEAVTEAILVVDSQLRIEFSNTQAELLFGYAQADLVGAPLSMLLAPGDGARHLQSFFDALGKDHQRLERTVVQLSAQTQGAAQIPIELSLHPIYTTGQSLVLAVIRKAAARQTGGVSIAVEDPRAHKRLDRAVHSTALLDRAGYVVAINDAWRLLEADKANCSLLWANIGEPFLDACSRASDLSTASIRGGILDVISGKRDVFAQIYRCHSTTQLRWFRLQAHSLDSSDGTVLVNQHDITDVQQAHARLHIQNTVSKALNSRLPMLAACRELALSLCQELDWDFAGIWTLETSSWTLHCVDTWVGPELKLRAFESASRAVGLGPGTGLPGRAWSSAKIQWVNNTDVDPVVTRDGHGPPTIMPPAALSAGFRTALCFPLKCGGDVLAVVEVLSLITRPEDRALMDLLEVSGDQLALWELRERAENCALLAQQQADDARMQLESVLDCTPAFITAIDRDGKLLFVNKTIPPERKANAIGAPWRDFIVAESQAQVESALSAVLTTGAATAYEAKVSLPDGQWLWFANYMGPMRDRDAIVGAVIVSQDVTATKRSQEELLAAQRLAAVGTLAAGVAHEINTPIQFVNDSIHFLRDAAREIFTLIDKLQIFHRMSLGKADAHALQLATVAVAEAEESADLEYMHAHVPKAFERCIDGMERVATIVRSMKEFAHPAQKEMAPVDLNRAIMATLTVARNEYKYLADLETELEPLPPVICHANDISQVVLNIVVNAAHAIAEAPQKGNRGLIMVKTRCDGTWAVISIRDTGGGIPEEVRQRIFDPFFTTKEVGRGTGQGLSIAWATVKDKHGGELNFETIMGEGTTFQIRLPIGGRPQGAA